MKRIKRVLALIGVIGLLILYIATLISAFFTTPVTAGLFKACIFSTFFVPIFIYAFLLIYRVLKKSKHPYEEEEK